jgi:branched-chain amino acid transport system permease protein
MSFTLLAVQVLNGLQFGVILFLVAAGLTLVFGVMDFVNLAHGVQYMLGAYLTATAVAKTGSFLAGLVLGLAGSLVLGFLFELVLFRHLTRRGHLEQVLATFAVILVVTDLVRMIFGPAPIAMPLPAALSGSIALMPGLAYPVWRLVIIAAGLVTAFLLWFLITQTRTGMLLRAGSTHPTVVSALGVDIDRVFLFVFAFGAMLAGFAGAMAGPILSVEPAMGDTVLILAFVVIVIGGIGAVRGALIASLIVGLIDTLGRAFATDLLRLVLDRSAAAQAGPALASMAIYIFMAAVLIVKPTGLFTGERAWTRAS